MPTWGWVCVALTVVAVAFVAYVAVTESKRRKYTLENGAKTHGWLVQANAALFEPGNANNPALVVISPDARTNDDEEFMTDLAERIMELKGEEGETKAERKVARLMADETYISGKRDELPAEFTDGKTVFLVHIMIYRDHLPGKKIEERKIPCAIVWDEPGTLVCTRPAPSGRRKWRSADDDEE
jgi:hypothetical protein